MTLLGGPPPSEGFGIFTGILGDVVGERPHYGVANGRDGEAGEGSSDSLSLTLSVLPLVQ